MIQFGPQIDPNHPDCHPDWRKKTQASPPLLQAQIDAANRYLESVAAYVRFAVARDAALERRLAALETAAFDKRIAALETRLAALSQPAPSQEDCLANTVAAPAATSPLKQQRLNASRDGLEPSDGAVVSGGAYRALIERMAGMCERTSDADATMLAAQVSRTVRFLQNEVAGQQRQEYAASAEAAAERHGASACEPYRDEILAWIASGRCARRIWEELVRRGFPRKYHSVRRYVARLRIEQERDMLSRIQGQTERC